jgi:hypothetical protein
MAQGERRGGYFARIRSPKAARRQTPQDPKVQGEGKGGRTRRDRYWPFAAIGAQLFHAAPGHLVCIISGFDSTA